MTGQSETDRFARSGPWARLFLGISGRTGPQREHSKYLDSKLRGSHLMVDVTCRIETYSRIALTSLGFTSRFDPNFTSPHSEVYEKAAFKSCQKALSIGSSTIPHLETKPANPNQSFSHHPINFRPIQLFQIPKRKRKSNS
jgi:hypothetical protein